MRIRRRSPQGFSDHLNYAHIVHDGVIINKDGAFLTTFKYQPPDNQSASDGELDALTNMINRACLSLDDGWMLHADVLRIPSITYSEQGYFPDKVSALIDMERRQHYEAEGRHFENVYFFTLVWKFPLTLVKTSRHWFIENVEKETEQSLTQLLGSFLDKVESCVNLLSSVMLIERLGSEDLLTYLGTCISGNLLPITMPKDGLFVDVSLSRNNVIGGYSPKIGDNHIMTLVINDFDGTDTHISLLEELATYPIQYRWSNRFVPLSETTADREIKRFQRNWHNKVKGFVGMVKESVFGLTSDKVNVDALGMKKQTQTALTANSNGSTRFGYWTSTLVLMHPDLALLRHTANELKNYVERVGFTLIEEDMNALDAWLGTLPGHGSHQLRRLFINAINLAHLLPLHGVWTGTPFSQTSSLLPANSPPVFYAATTGKTPFRSHMDVGGVGHQLVIGPTGSGKSTYLDFLMAGFLRYKNAQIYVFDKNNSHLGFCKSVNGQHYPIGMADHLSFCPLADLSTGSKRLRATQWVEQLIELQNVKLTPRIRQAVNIAIEVLSDPHHEGHRTLTLLASQIQHEEARHAINYYTVGGTCSLLDAERDPLQNHHFQVFEMGWLLDQRPEIYIPTLAYLFDKIESQLEANQGKFPTLIVLEEAWLYLIHPFFAKKIKDWLKTLRKYNARVVFVSQSLADLYDPSTKTLTSTTAAILESCPTKIYLPHQGMEAETTSLYRLLGLSERQIEIISKEAIPKQHYYVVTPEGDRLIDLGLTAMPLSFLGLSLEKTQDLITCQKTYGDKWLPNWLEERGQTDWIGNLDMARYYQSDSEETFA